MNKIKATLLAVIGLAIAATYQNCGGDFDKAVYLNEDGELSSASDIPNIVTPPMNVSIQEGQTAAFSVVATGSNLTYQWYREGNAILNATSASYSIANAQVSQAGTYSVVVTNDAGSDTAVATLAVTPAQTTPTPPPPPPPPTTATVQVLSRTLGRGCNDVQPGAQTGTIVLATGGSVSDSSGCTITDPSGGLEGFSCSGYVSIGSEVKSFNLSGMGSVTVSGYTFTIQLANGGSGNGYGSQCFVTLRR